MVLPVDVVNMYLAMYGVKLHTQCTSNNFVEQMSTFMPNDRLRSCGKRTYTEIDGQNNPCINMKVEVETKPELDPTATNGCVYMPHSPKSRLLSLNWKQLGFPSVQRIMTPWDVNLWQFECISQQVREVKLQQQLLCSSSCTKSFPLKLIIDHGQHPLCYTVTKTRLQQLSNRCLNQMQTTSLP